MTKGFYDVVVELPVGVEDENGNIENKGRTYKEESLDKLIDEIVEDGGMVESAVLVFYDKPREVVSKTKMVRDLVKQRSD